MELKSGDLFFFIRSFCGKIKEGIEKKNMEKAKVQKEVNVELFS